MKNICLLICGVKSLQNSIINRIKTERIKEVELVSKLDGLSPLKKLTRSYSIVEYKGKLVKSSNVLKAGDEISIRFSEGTKNAKII